MVYGLIAENGKVTMYFAEFDPKASKKSGHTKTITKHFTTDEIKFMVRQLRSWNKIAMEQKAEIKKNRG